jgi:homoserine dehydrogenase
MKQIGLGLLGLGTVGTGLCKLVMENKELIEKRMGISLELKKALVRDLNRERILSQGQLTTDPNEILKDPSIQIVVEVMGGVEPAKTYITEALKAGKAVVTANKELIAKEGHELLTLATEVGQDLYFEASVAGGIPIIRTLKESLIGNRITGIFGIINGTTNYILTKMSQEGSSLESALAAAQRKGYAEADPSSDVEGWDAAYKLAILASIAFGSRVEIGKVHVEGICKIEPEDLKYSQELGYTLKLLAIGKNSPEGIQVRVHPTLIPQQHPLATVSGVYNAVFLEDDSFGELMFYGRGAGELPTGSAVLSDVIACGRDLVLGKAGSLNCTCFEERPVLPMDDVQCKYYVRLVVDDRPGVLAKIADCFGSNGVSLAQVIQKGYEEPVDLVFVSHRVQEGQMKKALAQIEALPFVHKVANLIRVEGEEQFGTAAR